MCGSEIICGVVDFFYRWKISCGGPIYGLAIVLSSATSSAWRIIPGNCPCCCSGGGVAFVLPSGVPQELHMIWVDVGGHPSPR